MVVTLVTVVLPLITVLAAAALITQVLAAPAWLVLLFWHYLLMPYLLMLAVAQFRLARQAN